MCGIVGYAGREAIGETQLIAMRDTLVHRGPDDAGCWFAAGRLAGLAHRRLSIIDLSPAGHQPMADAAGAVHVAFNGEIYNFLDLRRELEAKGRSFRSHSDTEVLLAAYDAWGEAFVERLNGMFAIALYDERNRELLLARDRAGEKPLFYWRTSHRILFASELKALYAFPEFPRRLDLEALEDYLAYGYIPGSHCIIDGVQKLAPAHVARFHAESGAWSERAYWSIPLHEANGAYDANAIEAEFEALLEDAVRKQLMASDVPVAVLLSGGIDSSLVTAMAARARSNVKTFTVSFPGHGAFDEAPYARLVAKHFGTDHTELSAHDAEFDLLPRLAAQYDEPMADSSMVPTFLVSSLIREHATVALGGDGGDELFAGYPHYTWIPRFEQVKKLTPRPLARAVGAAAQRFLPPGTRGRSYLAALAQRDVRESLGAVNVYFDPKLRRQLLLRKPEPGAISPEQYRILAGGDGGSLLQAAQRMDFRTYLPDDILVKVDRASMLTSLETRAPFLDHRLIEFAFGRVPDALKANRSERKILLRRAGARLLPRELDLTRKQGFSIPLGTWFAGSWGAPMREILRTASPDLFDRAAIEQLISGQERGLTNAHRLFTLVIFELWRRTYGVTL